MNRNPTGSTPEPLFSAKTQERHDQRADRHGGNDSTEPIMAPHGGMEASDDAGQPDDQGNDRGRHALVENERVDPAPLATTGLCFGLRLVENPIDTIGPDFMLPHSHAERGKNKDANKERVHEHQPDYE